ncbi:MAG: 5-formyltetrahydrofolate cyclo-ligase [Ruminococcus sp.]
MDILAVKKNLRREMKTLRKSIPREEKAELDRKMRENFFASDIYKNAEMILTFISFGDEPDTTEILKRAWQDKKTTAVPRCMPESRMSFYIINDMNDCIEGAYGIPEPSGECPEAALDGKGIVCLVPGLAFDRKGGRLGYGGGYYDRFLSRHPDIQTFGFCAEMFVAEDVPQEDTDVKLRGLITDKTVEVI